MSLADAHRAHLRTSALGDEILEREGIYSSTDGKRLAEILKWKTWPKARGAAIVFPVFEPGSDKPAHERVRPDKPRTNPKTGKLVKYEQPKDVPTSLYIPRACWPLLRDVSVPLVLTEGEKKALVLAQAGLCAIGAPGVDNFHDTSDPDREHLHPWFHKHVLCAGRACVIAFDSDIEKPVKAGQERSGTLAAARKLSWWLQRHGARHVARVSWPEGTPDKLGVDDWAYRRMQPQVDAGVAEDAARAIAMAELAAFITGGA